MNTIFCYSGCYFGGGKEFLLNLLVCVIFITLETSEVM